MAQGKIRKGHSLEKRRTIREKVILSSEYFRKWKGMIREAFLTLAFF